MIAASSFIDSDFKTENVKAECNKAVLNPLFLFHFSSYKNKQQND